MTPERRLAELAAQYALPASAPGALLRLLTLLAEDPTAPTAVTQPAVAVDAHVADALVALELAEVRQAGSIADLGSGAGLPGLVLAAALPQARVALVEAIRRKCAFLERAAVEMGLTTTVVVPSRAESWQAGMGCQDVVTARAVAPLTVLVEYAAPLLRPGGSFVAWKGRRDRDEEADGAAAAAATGLECVEIRRVQPWSGAEQLHLYVYLKVGSTPKRFPRREGMARKRPITASR